VYLVHTRSWEVDRIAPCEGLDGAASQNIQIFHYMLHSCSVYSSIARGGDGGARAEML
jgi:hypothetical protein